MSKPGIARKGRAVETVASDGQQIAHKERGTLLYRLAKEALETRDNNIEKAKNWLVSRLRNERELLDAVVQDVVQLAVKSRLESILHSQRQKIENSANRGDVIALGEGTGKALLDFPLRGGLKLRDATRSEIKVTADFYENNSTVMARKARWLHLIMQSLPEGKKVSEVISDERVHELWESSQNA